jgi:hypothetical protein
MIDELRNAFELHRRNSAFGALTSRSAGSAALVQGRSWRRFVRWR